MPLSTLFFPSYSFLSSIFETFSRQNDRPEACGPAVVIRILSLFEWEGLNVSLDPLLQSEAHRLLAVACCAGWPAADGKSPGDERGC